jgi:hypothetical protein
MFLPARRGSANPKEQAEHRPGRVTAYCVLNGKHANLFRKLKASKNDRMTAFAFLQYKIRKETL